MAGLLPYHIIRFPLREFLADRQVTQAAAARGIGVNVYTLSHWVTTSRTPLGAYKALLQKFDPESATPFAAPNRYRIERWASAKPCATTAVTQELVERWDARHDGMVLETADGERLHVRHPAAHLGRSAPPASPTPAVPAMAKPSLAATDVGSPRGADGGPAIAGVAPAGAPVGTLPPESVVLLALLREVADQRNRARDEKATAEERAAVLQTQVATLETTVATLEGHVVKLEGDVAEWEALVEARTAPPEPDPAAAVENVRIALEREAPELVSTLEEILGNSAGSCR